MKVLKESHASFKGVSPGFHASLMGCEGRLMDVSKCSRGTSKFQCFSMVFSRLFCFRQFKEVSTAFQAYFKGFQEDVKGVSRVFNLSYKGAYRVC